METEKYRTPCIACDKLSEAAFQFELRGAPALCTQCAEDVCKAIYDTHGAYPYYGDPTPATYRKVRIPEALRWQVFERDNFTCRKCPSRTWLRADHIVAESKGGEATLGNLQTLCRSCNSSKGAR